MCVEFEHQSEINWTKLLFRLRPQWPKQRAALNIK